MGTKVVAFGFEGAGFAGDRPSGRARLAFEKRAGAHGVHPDTPRGRT